MEGVRNMTDVQLFEDYINRYINIEKEDWIPLYEEDEITINGIKNDIFGLSALINNDEQSISNYLKDYEWGFSPNTFGKSYYEKTYSNNVEMIDFIVGDKKDDIEYLIAYRTFNRKYEKVIEINPKLIWYYNLVKEGDTYVDPINDEPKIRLEKKRILVLKTYLKDFLNAHKKSCIICFDHRRFFKTDSKLAHEVKRIQGENHNFVIVRNSYTYNEFNGMSSILGKVIIKPYTKSNHRDYLYLEEEKKYERFIIGVDDETGEEVEFTCNENELANYFGKNPDAPHFLTPVYFDRKVLDRYTNDPSNYKVDDGLIVFLDEWSLPFTINNDNKVIVWLGDLGRIPYNEQKHWKIHNNKPQGGIEKKFFQRQMMAQFTDSITPEKKLFELIDEFNKIMHEKYGDIVFNELSEADSQIKSAFSIPTNNSTTAYQTYLMQLCKIVVESINTRLIQSIIPKERLTDENNRLFGSRLQLKVFLDELGIPGSEKLDNILKIIYNSRNKLAGHTGSIQEYNKVWKRDKNYKPNFISDSKIILTTLNNILNDIIGELV